MKIIFIHSGKPGAPVEFWMCVEKGINKTTGSKAHAAKFDIQLQDMALRQVKILYPTHICGLMDPALTFLPEKYLPQDHEAVTRDPALPDRRKVLDDIKPAKKTLGKIEESTGLDRQVVKDALHDMRGAGMVKTEKHSWTVA